MYEIEKRGIVSRQEMDNLEAYLSENGVFIEERVMSSYLFRKPTFLRIRIFDSGLTRITEKFGSYTEAGRREEEFEIQKSELEEFVEKKAEEGYTHCAVVHTKRRSYLLDDLKVELNETDCLGLIVEVETVTDDESEIQKLEQQVENTMAKLGLEELDPVEYQIMMNQMYEETTAQVSRHLHL